MPIKAKSLQMQGEAQNIKESEDKIEQNLCHFKFDHFKDLRMVKVLAKVRLRADGRPDFVLVESRHI